MQPSRPRIPFFMLLRFLTAALLLVLGGCWSARDDGRVAGGDDIPNDVEPLGKKAARARDDSADWNGYKAAPHSAPGLYDTATVPDSVPDTTGAGARPEPSSASALAKRTESLPGLPVPMEPVDTVVHTVDTVTGVVQTVHTQVKDSVVRVDSIVFVPADPADPGAPRGVLQVTGRTTLADTSLWRAYGYKDADGDGFLAPRAGSRNLADLDVSVKGPSGVVERTVRRVAAGADLDFNAGGDNRLLASTTVLTLDADTLDIITLVDADGDSLVLDFSKDTNLVDVIAEHRYPDDPIRLSATSRTRLAVFPGDSTRNYAVLFDSTSIFRDGGRLVVAARGFGSDSTFHPGAEALWRETRTPPAGDSLALRTRTYSVRLSKSPGGFAGNLLVGLSLEERYRNTDQESFRFALLPEDPIAAGGWPASGAVTASLTATDGKAISFQGQAVADGMEGVVEDSAGVSIPIFFDRNGAATRR